MVNEIREADECVYLKEEEICLLLAGMGIGKKYGFIFGQKCNLLQSKQEAYRVLAGMYQKNIVEWTECKIQIIEPFHTMLKVMEQAQYCMTVHILETSKLEKIYYFSDKSVLEISVSLWEKETLRIALYGLSVFAGVFWENCGFPREEVAAETITAGQKNRVIAKLLLRQAENGNILESMQIEENGLVVSLRWEKEGNVNVVSPSRQCCERILCRWMNNGED